MPGKLSVLLVEDDPLLRKTIVKFLLAKLYETGFTPMIRQAGNGREAISSLEEAAEVGNMTMFDLVVTDLDMPVMDGLELAKEVKAEYPGLPVFLWTGRARTLGDTPLTDMVFDKTDTEGLLAAIVARFALKP